MGWFSKFISSWSGNGGFESGKQTSTRRNYVPTRTVKDLKEDLPSRTRTQLVKHSRYVHRNSGFHRSTVNTMIAWVVGNGITPVSNAEDVEAGNEYENIFREFSNKADVTNRFNLNQLCSLICRAIEIDGEAFVIKTKDAFGNPKLQVLETQHISTETDKKRNLWEGIEFDSVGRPKFYHVISGKNEKTGMPNIRKVPANSVLHVYEPESVSGVRGMPPNQAGLNALRDYMELLANETSAVKSAGAIGLLVKSNREDANDSMGFNPIGSSSSESGSSDSAAAIQGHLGYSAVRLNEGEDITTIASARPNSQFDGFIESLKRESLGNLPYEIVGDPSKVGGASVRLVTAKADKVFNQRQRTIIEKFLVPVWGYVIGNAIAENQVKAVKGWNSASWQTPKKLSVDSGREEQQARANLETGLTTFSEYLGERGGNFDDHLAKRTQEARKIMTAAGYDESEPIPIFMLYKPTGSPVVAPEMEETD